MIDPLPRLYEIFINDCAHEATVAVAAKNKNAPPDWDDKVTHDWKRFREAHRDELIFLMLRHLINRENARAESPH